MFGYTEQIIWIILKSSLTINTFTHILMSILAIILRTHIDMLMAWCMITQNFYVNVIVRICISSTLVINSKHIFDIIYRYKLQLYQHVEQLVHCYTEENFKKWMRYFVLSTCIYFYIATYLVTITNGIIRQMIIEFISCYHIIEIYERFNKSKFKLYQIKEFECTKNENVIIKENYHPDLFDVKGKPD